MYWTWACIIYFLHFSKISLSLPPLSITIFPPLITTFKLQNLTWYQSPRSMASTIPRESSQSTHTTLVQSPPTHIASSQSPLLLLSNMSNLMSINLDYTNYIQWKYQLITILEAYSLIKHINGTTLKPSPLVLDAIGNPTSVVNPNFQAWKIKEKALLSLINSTLTPQVFSLVFGITSSREV